MSLWFNAADTPGTVYIPRTQRCPRPTVFFVLRLFMLLKAREFDLEFFGTECTSNTLVFTANEDHWLVRPSRITEAWGTHRTAGVALD